MLTVLCRCPLTPRNNQQEFVNKHTLLTDKMLSCLIELMALPIDEDDDIVNIDSQDTAPATESNNNTATSPVSAVSGIASSNSTTVPTVPNVTGIESNTSSTPTMVSSNPSNMSHLPSMVDPTIAAKKSSAVSTDTPLTASGAVVSATTEAKQFFPNSLVIVGAAALLESLISSKRDTSSPELLNRILDLLSKRCEVLVHMLRSNAFIIMENAAILIFVLLRNRPTVAPALKDMCLSECLVLKHFYNGAFSPSAAQRFISRFLVATWMSGDPKTSKISNNC